MKELICTNPIFGFTLSLASYGIGVFLQRKTKKAIVNPLLISFIIIIPVLLIFRIPLSYYNKGGELLNFFLAPATAALALNVYRQRKLIKENFVALLAGTLSGSAVSIFFIFALGRIMRLDENMIHSVIPKSITTAMAIVVSGSIGGIPSITVVAVVLTGVLGSIMAPFMIRLLKVDNPIAQGVGIGTCSHAIGTAKAIELGEVQGAISSVALTFSGIVTVIISMIFFK